MLTAHFDKNGFVITHANAITGIDFVCVDAKGYYLGAINDPNVWRFASKDEAIRARIHLYFKTPAKYCSEGIWNVLTGSDFKIAKLHSKISHEVAFCKCKGD